MYLLFTIKLHFITFITNLNLGSNGHSQHVMSGDHVEFLFGNNIDNIFIRQIGLYEEFKPILDSLKKEMSKSPIKLLNLILT